MNTDLHESTGAKRLFTKVNRMLNKVDFLVESLTEKEKQIEEHLKVKGKNQNICLKNRITVNIFFSLPIYRPPICLRLTRRLTPGIS